MKNSILTWFKRKRKETIGERAMREVCELLSYKMNQSDTLKSRGWGVVNMPLVNNERLWFHKSFGYKTQSEAIKMVNW